MGSWWLHTRCLCYRLQNGIRSQHCIRSDTCSHIRLQICTVGLNWCQDSHKCHACCRTGAYRECMGDLEWEQQLVDPSA
jgi:hypothetical protein